MEKTRGIDRWMDGRMCDAHMFKNFILHPIRRFLPSQKGNKFGLNFLGIGQPGAQSMRG